MVALGLTTNDQVKNIDIAAEIFAKYERFIRGVIKYKVCNEDIAEDLFQNFFLSLVRRPPSPNIMNMKDYLYRAIINDIIDYSRHTERYKSKIYEYAKHYSLSGIEEYPEKTLIKTEEIDRMFRCIEKRLQHCEARAIILRYKDNCKIREIARLMSTNTTTAWRYISKGVRKIRRLLVEDSYNDRS